MAGGQSPGRAGAGPLGSLLLVLLLVASLATFAATRAARSEADVVNSVVLTPLPDRGATVEFRLTEPDSRADVLIVDEQGLQVRALQLGTALRPGPQRFRWDGTGDDGEPVPAGSYSVRVILNELGRDIEPPGTIEVL